MPETEKCKTPLLSIITINYNNADGLQKTIESVMSQKLDDYSEIEYIIVDGGSKDASVEVIQNGIKDSRIFVDWKSEPDKGIYNAMNKGIKKVHGNFLLFLNSGDYLFSDRVLSNVLNDLDFTKTNTIYYADVMASYSDKSFYKEKHPDILSFDYLCKTSLSHQATLFSSDLFSKNLYDESYKISSDWKYCIDAYLNGTNFIYYDAILSVYDMTGISSTNSNLLLSERNDIIKKTLPAGLVKDYERSFANPLNEWLYYGKCFYQNKSIYKFQLYIQKVIFKLLRVIKVLKRIDI